MVEALSLFGLDVSQVVVIFDKLMNYEGRNGSSMKEHLENIWLGKVEAYLDRKTLMEVWDQNATHMHLPEPGSC